MIIVKIGGGDGINLDGTIRNLAEMSEQMIIVHGANCLRDEVAEKMNTPRRTITSVSGYSSVFSDEDAISNIMMTYSGLRNKRIVELCQRNGINAIGLTGLDGRLIQGRRNQGIRIEENGKKKIVRDFSGKPQSINQELIELLIGNGYTPVISIPIIDEEGFAINTENDDVIRLLHETFGATQIIQLIGERGLLRDNSDQNSLINSMNSNELEEFENSVDGRMKRKILALRRLFEKGNTEVIISDGRVENPVNDAINGRGTIIR